MRSTKFFGNRQLRSRTIEDQLTDWCGNQKRDPSARPQLLGDLCEPTGGQCLSLDQRDQLLAHLQALWQVRETDRKWNYVFDRPTVFALIAVFLGLEWFLRRRSGML